MPTVKPEFFMAEAKEFALLSIQERFTHVSTTPITVDDLYIVWFSKTLQNYKALISTDRYDGVYVEVTFDGNKNQAYVDLYFKHSNKAIPRETLTAILTDQNKENTPA